MLISFKKEHLREVAVLLKKHKVQHSPFQKVLGQYACYILENEDAAVLTFLILSDKITVEHRIKELDLRSIS